MKKNLKELLDKINAKKKEVKDLVAENKLAEAEAAKEELKKLQQSFDLLYDLDADEQEGAAEEIQNGSKKPAGAAKPTAGEIADAFVSAIVCGVKRVAMPKRDAEIMNEMNESDPIADESDGGITVPQDIHTEIRELRRGADNLEDIVGVEYVTTKSGSRPIEKNADSTPWDEVEEGDDFGEETTPKLTLVKYAIKKFGGILTITKELLEDTAENILRYLKKWIAKKTKATRNAKILAAFESISGASAVPLTDIADIKKVLNVSLDPAIAKKARFVTNQSGFNILDGMEDENGHSYLRPDARDESQLRLLGKLVTVLSDDTLPSTNVYDNESPETAIAVRHPLYIGDTKEAVTLFDRRVISVDISTVAGDLWKKDKAGIKARDRFDVQAVDSGALKKGYFEEAISAT